MSLIACGSVHQGHERVILVMTLEEDKRFFCVWLLYYASNFCRFANGARYQDIDQALLHGDHFLLSAISGRLLSLGQKYFYSELTADCSLLVEGESIIRSILRLLRR